MRILLRRYGFSICSLIFLDVFAERIGRRRVIWRPMLSLFATYRILRSVMSFFSYPRHLIYRQFDFTTVSLLSKYSSPFITFVFSAGFLFTLIYTSLKYFYGIFFILSNRDGLRYGWMVSKNSGTGNIDIISSSSVLILCNSIMGCFFTYFPSASTLNSSSSTPSSY